MSLDKTISNATKKLTNQDLLELLRPLKFAKPSAPIVFNKYWQVVNDPYQEIYLYSAFYDDRKAVAKSHVRIVTIAQEADTPLFCLIWYRNRLRPDAELVTKMISGPVIIRSGRRFAPYIFSCEIPTNRWPPEAVSVITTESIVPSTLMNVHLPERPAVPFDFGVCVSVSYGYPDPKRIVEWIELHKTWGVSEIVIYNNNLTEKTLRVFDYYVQQGFVDLREAPDCMDIKGELTTLLNMSPTLNDCMYRNMYRFNKIIVVDLDEIIVPRQHANYQIMLDAIDEEHIQQHPYQSYMFTNVYFFLDFPAEQTSMPFLTICNFFKRIKPSKYGYSIKSITDPQVCIALQNHLCWHVFPKYNTSDWLISVNSSVSMNQHYKTCHLDEYEGKPGLCEKVMREEGVVDDIMTRHMDPLTTTIIEAMWRLNLIDLMNIFEEYDVNDDSGRPVNLDPSGKDPNTQPVDPNTQQVDHKVQQVNSNIQPVDPKVQPVDSNIEPVDPNTHVQPVDPNTQSVDPTTQPVDPNIQAVHPNVQPVNHSIQPVDSNIEPVDPKIQPIYPKIQQVDSNLQPVDHNLQPVDPNILQVDAKVQVEPKVQQVDPKVQLHTKV